MINVAYGILTNGAVSPDDLGYRYSDARCPAVVRSSVSAIMSKVPDNHKGVLAELLLSLMRTSSDWVTYVKKYDPLNTYQTTVIEDRVYEELKGLTFSDIVKWADSVNTTMGEFTKTDHDTAIDRVCGALFYITSRPIE